MKTTMAAMRSHVIKCYRVVCDNCDEDEVAATTRLRLPKHFSDWDGKSKTKCTLLLGVQNVASGNALSR